MQVRGHGEVPQEGQVQKGAQPSRAIIPQGQVQDEVLPLLSQQNTIM